MIFWDTISIYNVVGRDLAQKKFVIADEIDPKHAQCIIFFGNVRFQTKTFGFCLGFTLKIQWISNGNPRKNHHILSEI